MRTFLFGSSWTSVYPKAVPYVVVTVTEWPPPPLSHRGRTPGAM
jgi:hypothetical protein